ncbi:HTTM domain-containing protein [Psychroserpens sp.]|uniref:HTTM domain-containing protein n=1 Tax=Psychroserpens sp. TaxID=2020870 RepID=UPI001B2E3095|nr:HTTM domain-containing protein [Psychroserpens sp.]MBO6607803.1 HTTM domain-containing protein [Psychroserpens sp.]MBO6631527.1 HTTM domain-containing protein [Psychroserpens sp.]MBO6654794.1 HTTM domain-containing protein [Psychroserpens sp.]MBO6682782.1 HTTM domain-containing protein [Psychroserpens sp.]MBO6751161.1 HTTM domain-containing protein [Psychroserpens sp.]
MSVLSQFLLRPFQFEGTKLHPNVLLMCKMLVYLMTAHHMFFKITDPFIPFIPAIDFLNEYPNVFKYAMRTLYILSAFALIFNIRARTASLTIGLVVIVNILASKTLFYNHTFICGCALFLAGLTNDKDPPYLLIYQLSLVYFGASINKFLDIDWWNGNFMETWLGSARENPVYLYVSDLLPEMVFAKMLSYIAMFTEFAIAVTILFKRTRLLTVWFIIIFHTLLFTLTSFRFGHFIESLAIVLLAFLNMPKTQMLIQYRSQTSKYLKSIFQFLDRDNKQKWIPLDSENFWLKLSYGDKTITNHHALKDLILYTPNFFIGLMILDMGSYVILYNHRTMLFILNVVIVWTLIFYFFSWKRRMPSEK